MYKYVEGVQLNMVKLDNNIMEYLRERELDNLQIAMSKQDKNEIEHWIKVANSRKSKRS